LFGVFLVGERAGRVGELDEEMVYESRVGDFFTLGSTSWRIEDITHDRVLVSPAPGLPGRLPFWKGDAVGRPVELGHAIGAFVRELGKLSPDRARERVTRAGLDQWATDNLLAYLDEQRQATGHLPDDRTIVVERFRDELGDWRVAVHSPFGARVHAPWALAIARRLRERFGVDVAAMHSDDGVVLRLPDTEERPPPDLAAFEPEEIEELVTAELGGSALFAARFRECAARALLLPRRQPGRRSPLWQQRQRSAQLLGVASEYPQFPVVLETMRECLQDVFDVPGLVQLMRDLQARRVRFVEVETSAPSPFARSLLMGYIAEFMYDGDSPLAERRAQALALDTGLLAELLGQAELRELLDPAVIDRVEAELQRRTPDRWARNIEEVADLLRLLGPLSGDEVTERCEPHPQGLAPEQDDLAGRDASIPTTVPSVPASMGERLVHGADPAGQAARWLGELAVARRAIPVRIGGQDRWAAIEDAGRLRDALGVPLPVGIPEAFLEPVRDPLGDLVSRYARTHGPFHAVDAADRFGLGVAVVNEALHRLAAGGRAVEGAFRPGGSGTEWCDPEVLRRIRRASLAALRKESEPVPAVALGRFLPVWQNVRGQGLRGVDGVLRSVEQLTGSPVPASALERLVLPARVADYAPAMLDELCAAGEVIWAGHGALPGDDGWISLYPADLAPLLMPPPDPDPAPTPLHSRILEALGDGHALFFRQLSDRIGSLDDTALATAVWDLVWSGCLTNDTLGPVRALVASGRPAHAGRKPTPRGRYSRSGRIGRAPMPSRTGPPSMAGRWSLLPERDADATRRGHALAETLLDRYGVLTRGSVVAERPVGGFAAIYRVLSAFEEAGRARRGYFVEGLGAAQFAMPGAVDSLRVLAGKTGDDALVLAAADPANPYGAALPWPERPGDVAGGHKAGRKAGALVVLVDGRLVLYVERGGRTLLTWSDRPEVLQPAVDGLALAVREGALGKLTVERADGEGVLMSPLGQALQAAGFHATPRGLRLRA
jgi:ATP-dependent Lhr-like helicase